MPSQMIIRMDSELKEKARNLARTEGKSLAEVVRKLLEEYVRNRDMGAYIDDLWDRIGNKLASKGFGPGDVQGVLREARKRK